MARRKSTAKAEVADDNVVDLGTVTPKELAFIEQYLVDFDPVDAAIRVGTPRLNAPKVSEQYLDTRRVQLEIQRRVDNAKVDQLCNPQRIVAGLIRESQRAYNSGAERISALRELGKIYRVIREDGSDPDAPVGGVMEVPGVLSPEGWEKLASVSQAELKKKVRE